jgi:tetratricopeptide (TPR) repeat protein
MGGLLFIAPLFAQPLIDVTDGICSHRFLISAEAAAKYYYDDLGVPADLSELIGSTYENRDQITSILYVYIAHFDKGMEETFNADLARILSLSTCFHIPESLFNHHLKINPRDYRAMGDYALLLARRGAFDQASTMLRKALPDADADSRKSIYEDLGIVLTMEYIKTGRARTRDRAFEAFRYSRYGKSAAPSALNAAVLNFNVGNAHSEGGWRHNYTIKVGHSYGSDAIILSIGANVAFGREIQTGVALDNPEELRKLFGSIYIAPGDSLVSKYGAFELSAEMGQFSPFYHGEADFDIKVLFPEGSIGTFSGGSPIKLTTERTLLPYYDALAYGEYVYAESVLTSIAQSFGRIDALPPRWQSSVKLSQILENPELWEYGLEFVDSLINEEVDPNLYVYKGALLYLLNRPQEAKEQFEIALFADPRNFWAVYNLALAEYDLGNKELAAELFIKTRQINQRMFLADLLAGVIYEELGRIDKALDLYEIALRNIAFRNDEVRKWIDELKEE